MFSKIYVFGAGAVGSYYGALLSQKYDVTLIARKKHVQAINRKGLFLTGKIKRKFKIKAVERVSKFDDNSLILLSTKATANKKVAKELSKKVGKKCVIVCLQNGLEVEDVVKKRVGKKAKVLRAVVRSAVDFTKPGVVRANVISKTEIEKSRIGKEIAKMFEACGMKLTITRKIKGKIWRKVIWNSVVNPLTAITRERNIVVLKMLAIAREIVKESVRVAECDGILLSEKQTLNYVLDGCKETKKNRSSMLQDVSAGRKTEINFLNGKIVEKARKYKIAAPMNELIVSAVREMES